MPLTRAAAESSVVGRVGAYTLGLAQMATTIVGSNADLNEPLARSLDHLGITPVDRAAIADVDLAVVVPALQTRFLDYLEIMLLESVRTRAVMLPKLQQWRNYQVQRDNFVAGIAALLADKWKLYRATYQYGGVPAVGQMTCQSRNPLTPAPYFPPFPGTLPWIP